MSPAASPWSWLTAAQSAVEAKGLARHPRLHDDDLLDLASNDYLGLAQHPLVLAGAIEAVVAHGTGSTGSRLVTGTHEVHLDLEQALATRGGSEAALVFSSGYLANLAAVSTLAGPEVLIVSDSANHASLIDGCRLSRSQVAVVPHFDVTAVADVLAGHQGRALVVTDAVFSVDGALAPLEDLLDVVRRHDALLLVDEAHSFGVLGPDGAGACALLGIAEDPQLVRTMTLSKALASQGGAVLCSHALREHLISTARAFVFDTGLAPAAAGAALAALSLVDDQQVAAVAASSAALSEALGVPNTEGPVVLVPIGDPLRAVAAQERCRELGVAVGCFRPPSVPDGESCLRLTVRADLSADDIALGAATVLNALGVHP